LPNPPAARLLEVGRAGRRCCARRSRTPPGPSFGAGKKKACSQPSFRGAFPTATWRQCCNAPILMLAISEIAQRLSAFRHATRSTACAGTRFASVGFAKWPIGVSFAPFRGLRRHANGPLADARFDGGVLSCRHHEWEFAGQCVKGKPCKIAECPVEIANDELLFDGAGVAPNRAA
jgi:toluene monooxygenase system ferredoxin subunit